MRPTKWSTRKVRGRCDRRDRQPDDGLRQRQRQPGQHADRHRGLDRVRRIATARSKGTTVDPALAVAPTTPYWTQVQNGSGEFTEPTASVDGYKSTTTTPEKGANCLLASFSGVPTTPAADPTLGDWSQTSGVNSPQGYGICTFTYGLVFDDNADVWGNSGEEESKARTVKDYWEGALTDGTQGQLFPADYAPLPANILAIARTGIAAVDWEKGEGGGGGGTTVPPGDGTTPGGNPPKGNKSNKFTLPRKKISSKTGKATISVKLPGAGKLELLGTAKVGKKTIKVGRTVLNANRAGTFNLEPTGRSCEEAAAHEGQVEGQVAAHVHAERRHLEHAEELDHAEAQEEEEELTGTSTDASPANDARAPHEPGRRLGVGSGARPRQRGR